MCNWTWFDRLFIAFFVGAVFAMTMGVVYAPAAECLPSAKAVWRAYDGAHAYWHEVEGRTCWNTERPERQERHHARIPTPRERSYARRDTLRDYERNPPAEWKMAERWTFTTDQPEFERLRWMAGVGQ